MASDGAIFGVRIKRLTILVPEMFSRQSWTGNSAICVCVVRCLQWS